MIQQSDYQTAVIGKWHVHSEPQGFDYYKVLPGQGFYFDPYFIESGSVWPETGYPTGQQQTGYVTDLITDDCLGEPENRSQ